MPVMSSHPAYADTKAFNVRPWNSSSRPVDPRDKTVVFDKDAEFYDMRGDKFMIILNQHTFEDTKHFLKQPSTRYGSYRDEWRLQRLFHKYGFLLFVLRDLRHQNIINFLTAFAALDHENTACICVTILTHGDTGGKIYAADKPYLLSEVMNIFESQTSLINKPKLFFVQACRGDRMDPGHAVYVRRQCESVCTQSDSSLFSPPHYISVMSVYYSSSEETNLIMQSGLAVTPPSRWRRFLNLFKVLRDAGHTDATPSNSEAVSLLRVPSHADTLVLCSTVENFLSYRDGNGSWMIQALCDTIEEHHADPNLVLNIIRMNRSVAYSKTTYGCRDVVMNNKKQMPETRLTLTKQLQFETVDVTENNTLYNYLYGPK